MKPYRICFGNVSAGMIVVNADSQEEAERYFERTHPGSRILSAREAERKDFLFGAAYDARMGKHPGTLLSRECLEFESVNFRYTLLNRMQAECEEYIGKGGRNPDLLLAGNAVAQVDWMKSVWDGLPVKPDWLTSEDIVYYEREMTGKSVNDLIAEASAKSEGQVERSNRCAVIRVFFDGEHVDNVFSNFDDVDRVCDAILNSPFVDIEDNTGKRQWLKENGGKAAPVVTFEIEDDGPEYYAGQDIEKG